MHINGVKWHIMFTAFTLHFVALVFQILHVWEKMLKILFNFILCLKFECDSFHVDSMFQQ